MRQLTAVPRQKRQKGSVFVESALVLVVFIMMIIACIDFAQFLFVHQSLVESCRKAARFAAVNAYDETAIRNVVMYDSPTPAAGTPVRFNLEASMVEIRHLDAGNTADRVEVKISNFPFQVYTPMVAGTLRGLPIVTTLPYEGERR